MRTREDLEAEALRSGCRLVGVYRDEHGRIVGEWECPDAEEGRPMATAMLLEGLLDGDAAAREIPEGVTRILRAQGPRAARMAHAFVRQRVEFRPEETETFQSPGATLALGYGDCDDSARALVALARAAGIPARMVYFLQDGQPAHVTAQVFDAGAWRWAEATVAARYGEHPFAACKRLRMARPDMGGTPHVLQNGRAVPLRGGMGAMRSMGTTATGLPANLGPDFPNVLAAQADTIGADPLDVLKLLLSESGLQPGATNHTGFTNGGYAVGINQFAPVNWHFFAPLSAATYAALTAEQQLPYVFAYFLALMRSRGLSAISGRDLYWLNFLPATYVQDAPDDHVIVRRGSGYYGPNKGLDHGGKGYITAGDLQQSLDAQASSSLYQALAPLVGGAPSQAGVGSAMLLFIAAGVGAALGRLGIFS